MLDRVAERVAAGSDPRFEAFVNGKRSYEAAVAEVGRQFHDLTPADFERARHDTRLDDARRQFENAVELSERANAIVDAATARYQLGLVHHLRGEHEAAREALVGALRVFAALPDVEMSKPASDCHYHLGVLALHEHRLADAVRQLQRARLIDNALSDLSGASLSEQAMARCIAEGGNADAPAPWDAELFGRWESAIVQEATPDALDTTDQSDRKRGPIAYNQREVVLLASHTVEANDAVEEQLETLGDEMGRPVVISRVAFAAARPELRRLPEPEPDQHVCAAVLVLEREGLDDAAFQQFGFACIQQVMMRADFRLLVYLYDVDLHELRAIADENAFVAELFDTTQVAEHPAGDVLRRSLVPFIRRVERVAAAERWRNARLRATSGLSSVIGIVFRVAVILAVAGYPMLRWFPDVVRAVPFAAKLAAFNTGMLAFALQAPLLFLLVRGPRAGLSASQGNRALGRYLLLCGIAMFGANATQQAVDGPGSWIWLGLGAGLVLDTVRRAGWNARRQLLDLGDLQKEATDEAHGDRSRTIDDGEPHNPFTCPFLPAPAPRIFISYSRSSEQAAGLATALFQDLTRAGSTPFLDRASIPVGASWRRALNQHLGECDAFVCILDAKSLQRPWVGAEVLAALAARRLTGTPDILLLLDPSVDATQPPVLPLFRGICEAFHEAPIPGRPRIVPLGSETRRVTSWALAPGRFQPMAVLTRLSAVPVWMALTVLAPIGGLGFLAGFILGPIALLQGTTQPFVSWLQGKGWLGWGLVLVTFWVGSMARHTVAIWAGERQPAPEFGALVPAISVVGLFWMAQLLALRAEALWLGWALVVGVAGWWVVGVGMRVSTEGVAAPRT
ncbi:MAG: TIR domain-containing protein [Gemmatimonadetes bacterium]|nr:TIR domain-containing protein [Gemmatimonadota bacterium]